MRHKSTTRRVAPIIHPLSTPPVPNADDPRGLDRLRRALLRHAGKDGLSGPELRRAAHLTAEGLRWGLGALRRRGEVEPGDGYPQPTYRATVATLNRPTAKPGPKVRPAPRELSRPEEARILADAIARNHATYDPSGPCALWDGPLDGDGEPVPIGGREVRAYIWARVLGEPLAPGQDLRRTCPDERCVNPSHHILVTGRALAGSYLSE